MNKIFENWIKISAVLVISCALNLISSSMTLVYAEFALRVEPFDGSFDLRFDKIDQLEPFAKEKEVTVTITTDIGKRYQLFQAVLIPLTNLEGETLPRGALTMYTLRSSNRYGTLDLDAGVPVTVGRRRIYTSDERGLSDSFTIVYALDYSLVNKPGLYRGRLNFFLEPIDSTQAPRTVELDVEADIAIPAKTEVATLTGSKTIYLESPPEQALPAEITISIQGQRAGQYRILQELEPPLNLEAEELTKGIFYSLTGGKNGILAHSGEIILKPGETVIYTSDRRGSDDEIDIAYQLQEGLQAGRYRGRINYYIESPALPGQRALIDTLQLDVNIKSIFEIRVTPESGGIIEFRDVAERKVQETEVLIEINTNLARPYQVSQDVASLLTSKDGKVISEGYFKFTTRPADDIQDGRVKGILKYPASSPVEVGGTTLFISNKRGEPDRFKVIYELTAPPDQRGGDYTTRINYSLSQIEIQ